MVEDMVSVELTVLAHKLHAGHEGEGGVQAESEALVCSWADTITVSCVTKCQESSAWNEGK